MAQDLRFYRDRLLQAILVAVGVVALWFFAHWLKDLYLGDLVSYQKQFTTTTQVNFMLMILTICTLRVVWKEFAFTLVELSIVLIIIGFVIAGISGGTSLVQSAKLNTIIQEVNNIRVATLNFRSRYNAIPGDMTTAFQIWGTTCGTGTSGQLGSCNGDGNGLIGLVGAVMNNNTPIEDLKFWQHLALSQMISGSYTGSVSASFTGGRQQAGVNIQSTAYGSGGGYWGRALGSPYIYANPASYNGVELGKVGSNGTYGSGLLSAIEAQRIDAKIDDGNGITGNVLGARGDDYMAQNNCMTGWVTATSAAYILNDSSPSCRIDFIFDSLR